MSSLPNDPQAGQQQTAVAAPDNDDETNNLNERNPAKVVSMEAMIEKAVMVLEQAAGPAGAPLNLFADCHGVLLMSSVAANAMIASACVGTGIFLAKVFHDDDENIWSGPVACGMTGTGWGLGVGATYQDAVVFLMSAQAVTDMGNSNVSVSLGAHAQATLGHGRSGGVSVTHYGTGNIMVAFTKGACLEVSVDGGMVVIRGETNAQFYKRDQVSAQDIVDGTVQVPADKGQPHLQQVYDMLTQLCVCGGRSDLPDNYKKGPGA